MNDCFGIVQADCSQGETATHELASKCDATCKNHATKLQQPSLCNIPSLQGTCARVIVNRKINFFHQVIHEQAELSHQRSSPCKQPGGHGVYHALMQVMLALVRRVPAAVVQELPDIIVSKADGTRPSRPPVPHNGQGR